MHLLSKIFSCVEINLMPTSPPRPTCKSVTFNSYISVWLLEAILSLETVVGKTISLVNVNLCVLFTLFKFRA